MELQSRYLSKNMRPTTGDDVALLHRELGQLIKAGQLDARIASREIDAKQFGPTTERAVALFQRKHNLPVSSDAPLVDERTARRINREVDRLPKPKVLFHIASGAVRREDGLPLKGILVRAAHEADQPSLCPGRRIRLGEDITDAEGRYTIRYELLPGVDAIHLRVSVISEDGKPVQSSNLVQNAKSLEIIDLIIPMTEKPDVRQRIEGTIVLEHGTPADKLKLRLYRHDFGGKATLISETSTLSGGEYAFTYDSGGKMQSLEVRTVTDDNEEIPLSKPLSDLGREPRTVVNLAAPARLQPMATEYRRLAVDLTPHVGQMSKLAEAKEDEDQQDLTVLNRATGWDTRLIALAATSERISADSGSEVKLPQEAVYGLLRAGLPSDKLLLAQVEPETAEKALKTVRDAGIVELTDDQIKEFKTTFATFSNTVRLNVLAPGSRSTYGALLDTSGLPENMREIFIPLYFNHRGNATKLWEKVKEKAIEEGLDEAQINKQIGKLQLQGKLAFLAGNSEGMTDRLLKKEINEPVQLVKQDYHHAETWETEVFDQAGIPENRRNLTADDKQKLAELIPTAYAAEKVEDRLHAYTEDMARKVRLSYPTQVVGRLIETDDKFKLPAAQAATVTLLKNAAEEGFRLGETPATAFLKTHPVVMEGMAASDVQAAKQQLQTLQRVYQITPSNEAMPVLMSLDMTSAYDVMAYNEEEFIALFDAKYLDLYQQSPLWGLAGLIRRKAQQVSSVTYNLFTIAKKMDSEPPVAGLSASVKVRESVRNELIKQFPTMASLFGSMDFCECEHCRSVLSPAAYLVDLLQFVDSEPGVWGNFLAQWEATHDNQEYPHKDADGNAMKPYEVLVERRPDLPHIALTCENTHTVLPYIDIVNEILEYYVAHDKLEEKAAHDTGDATTEELLAEPQYVIRAAYDKLREARYPLKLPFDLWIETVRQFCDYFETPLHRVLEVFRPGDDLFIEGKPIDRAAIFMEALGLLPAEVAIFTDPDPLSKWYKLYGFHTKTEATTEATDSTTGQRIDLNSAKALARRLGVTYKEITEIVQTGFVNPKLTELVLLYKLGVSIQDARLYKDHKPFYEQNKDLIGKVRSSLSSADQSRFDALSKMDPNRKRSGWEIINEVAAFELRIEEVATAFNAEPDDLETYVQDLPFDEILVLADPVAGCNFDLTTLQYADGTEADPIAFLRINLFVRLWRKLDWSIEETDRALCTFIPESTSFNENNLVKQPLKTALIYLSHLKTLDEKVRVGKQSRLKLLTLWSDIATTGKKPLYAQLFLTRSVLKTAPVFNHHLGKYLQFFDNVTNQYKPYYWDPNEPENSATGNVSLQTHMLAIQGALGLTTDEIGSVLEDGGKSLDISELSLSNVTLLYRYGLLAKALKLSVRELITLKQLSGLDPFKPLHSDPLATIKEDHPFSQTLRFVEVFEEVKDSGLKIEDLDYMLRHQFDETGKYRPDQQATFALLKTLAEGVYTIHQEHAVPNDPGVLSEEVLRQKLGLILPPEVAKRFLAILNGTAELTVAETDRFFVKHLKKQSLNESVTVGFLEKEDFDALIKPLPEINNDLTEDERNDAIKANEEQRTHKLAILGKAFFPFLKQRLIRQFIVQTMIAHTGADPALMESLITDERLLAMADSKPLLASFAATGERGVSAEFFDSDDLSEKPQPSKSVVRSVDTTLKDTEDSEGNPLNPANSARFEGYLEVPTPGAYRFYIELEKQDAKAELHFDHLPDPVFLEGSATTNNTTLGKELEEFIELQPGILYRFALELKALSSGGARLLVHGGTLPKDSVSQLKLYPLGAENAILLLTKALFLVQSLGLNEREIRYLLTHTSDFGNVDFSEIPIKSVGNTEKEKDLTTKRFYSFLRLAAYARLKRDLAGGTDDLIDIFEVNELTDADKLDRKVYPLIAKLTRRNKIMVKASAEALFETVTPNFTNEKRLLRLWNALQVVERFGVSVRSLQAWTRIVDPDVTSGQRFEIARDLKEAMKARFEPETWQRVAQPIFDKLRQRQRDGLVSYVMHQYGFDRLEQLYEHFLIDPGMEPVVQTSRIRLAIGSVQLFIQRCLLNLEPKVHPSTINSKHWEWMKRYRVWEANRKIFLFPENWLEPEFRDDKTHLFTELEGALLQGDVSSDLVDDAFLNYLKKLDELARLDIVAMHIEDDPDPARRTLHIFGRTFSSSHKYFYRRYAHQMWTPWEPVNTEIQGDHLAPVVWRDRLYLFWVTFMEKTEQPVGLGEMTATEKIKKLEVGTQHGVTEPNLANMTLSQVTRGIMESVDKLTIEAQLHWSEYLQGEWSTRESSGFSAVISKVVPRSFNADSVFIHVSKAYDPGEESGVYIHLGGDINSAFYLAGRNSKPKKATYNAKPANPYSANTERATRYSGTDALAVRFIQRIRSGPHRGKERKLEIKKIMQRNGTYTLLPCDNDLTALGVSEEASQDAANPGAVEAAIRSGIREIASLMKPAFYQDNRYNLFVEPNVAEKTIEEWEGWITRTPRPEPVWQGDDWWKGFVIIAQKPGEWSLSYPNNLRPGFEIDRKSLTNLTSDRDWLVNPATVLSFDDVLIGPAGQTGLQIVDDEVAETIAEGAMRVHVNPGSCLGSDRMVFLEEASRTLEENGLVRAAGGLNVVGSDGFNSALKKNFNELNRERFGAVNTSAGIAGR